MSFIGRPTSLGANFAPPGVGSASGALVADNEDLISSAARSDELSISQMADEFGVTMRTLRFYEEKGLLTPRRVGNRRFYGSQSRERLSLVLKGKSMGMGLDDVSALVSALESDGDDSQRAAQVQRICAEQLRHLQELKATIEAQIEQTERVMDGLSTV
ncbi:MAG: MerR family transcriptional regulator [Pseudomonadota bacterium]